MRVQFEDSQQTLHGRAEYEYNALNWRVIKRSDSDLTDANNELDQQRIMYYSASWQLLEERIDDDGPTFADSPTSADIDRHMQYAWGIRYIDDIYVHHEDTDKNGFYDKTYYHLTDPQFSTVALIDRSAIVAERVTYTAYGQGRHHWLFDVDGDGDVEIINDALAISALFGTQIVDPAYRSECDINRDGSIDSNDLAGWSGEKTALPFGLISDSSSGGVDNQIGYDGYVFNTETQEYLARNRFYEPELGRWLRRDPAVYADGMNLYEYSSSNPIGRTDSSGMKWKFVRDVGTLTGWIDPEGDNPSGASSDALLQFASTPQKMKERCCAQVTFIQVTKSDLLPPESASTLKTFAWLAARPYGRWVLDVRAYQTLEHPWYPNQVPGSIVSTMNDSPGQPLGQLTKDVRTYRFQAFTCAVCRQKIGNKRYNQDPPFGEVYGCIGWGQTFKFGTPNTIGTWTRHIADALGTGTGAATSSTMGQLSATTRNVSPSNNSFMVQMLNKWFP